MTRRGPVPVGNVVAEIMCQGLGRQRSAEQRDAVWQEVIGTELARMTRCGSVRRGRLDVIVANSTMIQELTFRKIEILDGLRQRLPEWEVHDIRFRVGRVDGA